LVSGLYDLTRSTRSYCRIMRGRGDLTGFTGAGDDDGATATESLAACICHALRRLYAISIAAFR